jgi:hypothetical protein
MTIWHMRIACCVPKATHTLRICNTFFSTATVVTRTCISVALYERKSLSNRNFILKCMEKYAQWKILFRDTKWLLSNMPYRCRDDRAVCACAVAHTIWPLHCQLAPWESNKVLFIFSGQRSVKPSEIYRRMKVQCGDSCLNFHLFGPMKEYLRGQKFADDDEVMETVQSWLTFWRLNYFFYFSTHCT